MAIGHVGMVLRFGTHNLRKTARFLGSSLRGFTIFSKKLNKAFVDVLQVKLKALIRYGKCLLKSC